LKHMLGDEGKVMKSYHAKPIDRRRFLARTGRYLAATALASGLGWVPQTASVLSPTTPSPGPDRRKLIIILFGGGTRCQETIDDPQRRHIPHLAGTLIPRGTLFTNMRVEHKVVHPNSAGSIVSGHWEWDDLDWTRPVAHPTVFEIFRRARSAPDTAAWAFVYASILAQTGVSLDGSHGSRYAANVVTPPTIRRETAEQIQQRLSAAAALGSPAAEIRAAAQCSQLARQSGRISSAGLLSPPARRFMAEQYRLWQAGNGTTSHDAFLTDCAIACMERFAPPVMMAALGEIDCAHYGCWSRYVEAIRRTDYLTERIWRAAERLEAYRENTLMLILPDHGRELDRPGHWGFIHHSDFYTGEGTDEGCRRVWMLALGPRVRPGRRIEQPVPITAAAATGLEYLDLAASAGAAASVWSKIA
ncbi:MAG: hypothetical protein JW810_04355, partial [Sedimentisphaerales bacterium]|nr:hypothetical protein [Sedimentisphaerales bacterium]